MHLPTLRGHLDPAQDETGTMPAVQVTILGPATKGGEMRPLTITLPPEVFAAH